MKPMIGQIQDVKEKGHKTVRYTTDYPVDTIRVCTTEGSA